MKAQTAVVLGATGFIGSYLVNELVNDPAYEIVRLLVRKKIFINNPKIQVVEVDFSKLNEFKNAIGSGDVLFCCIGTTMKAVKGDKAKYRSIDFDIAVNGAQYAREAGFSKYLLISTAGANAASGNFYTQLKGEVEDAIKAIDFTLMVILRPSILLGQRREFRLGERMAKGVMKLLAPLFVGGLQPYRAIHGEVVAKAMANAAKQSETGTRVLHYAEITALANGH